MTDALKARVLVCPECGCDEFHRTCEDKVRVLAVLTIPGAPESAEEKETGVAYYQDEVRADDEVYYKCTRCGAEPCPLDLKMTEREVEL